MKEKRICNGICKKFKVKKPAIGGRYEAKQGRCQTCDVWIDFHGAHTKDGQLATIDSEGWFCNCCNMRVRRNPRNLKYKNRIRNISQRIFGEKSDDFESKDQFQHKQNSDEDIDLDYFNNYRAKLLKKIAKLIPEKKSNNTNFEKLFAENNSLIHDIKQEFNCNIEQLINLIYSTRPNKLAMVVEFEHIQYKIDRIPTKQDITKYSRFTVTDYMLEFNSLEQLLNRLGYEPWHNNSKILDKTTNIDNSSQNMVTRSNIPLVDMNIDDLNRLIDKALHLIKSSKSGAHIKDLKMLLKLSHTQMSALATKLVRLDNIHRKEIQRTSQIPDILLYYEDTEINKHHTNKNEPIQNSHTESKQHDVIKNDQNIQNIAYQMINEYAVDKKYMNKQLQQQLTKDFIQSGSMKKVFSNNPTLSKKEIMNHIRISKRLPAELKKLENEGSLHPDPECSLQIALFATDYYEWIGGKNDNRITDLAISLSKCITENLELNEIFKKRKMIKSIQIPNTQNTQNYSNMQNDIKSDIIHTIHVSVAIAVWIATATLHKQYGNSAIFSNYDIIKKVFEQKLCSGTYSTVSDNIAGHCVANIKASTGSHRKLYRVGPRRYRLYKPSDPYHHTREGSNMAPPINKTPSQYTHLLDWYYNEYIKSNTESTMKQDSYQNQHELSQNNTKHNKIISNHARYWKEIMEWTSSDNRKNITDLVLKITQTFECYSEEVKSWCYQRRNDNGKQFSAIICHKYNSEICFRIDPYLFNITDDRIIHNKRWFFAEDKEKRINIHPNNHSIILQCLRHAFDVSA